jgi:transcriptional regulator with XRE-family HTH domain
MFRMLSQSEVVLITRRRAGFSQRDMGDSYDMSRYSYGRKERDEKEAARLMTFTMSFDELKDHEKCFILRKRKGLTQREVAALLGLSRYWINQKEVGHVDCSDLKKFWDEQ